MVESGDHWHIVHATKINYKDNESGIRLQTLVNEGLNLRVQRTRSTNA